VPINNKLIKLLRTYISIFNPSDLFVEKLTVVKNLKFPHLKSRKSKHEILEYF
jgi:hypothetical protein